MARLMIQRLVRVNGEDLATIDDQGTVIVITGTDARTGERITFAGDRRPMELLIESVLNGEEPLGNVDHWMVLSVTGGPR